MMHRKRLQKFLVAKLCILWYPIFARVRERSLPEGATLGPADAQHRFGKQGRAICPRVNTRNSTMEAVNLQKKTLQLQRVYSACSGHAIADMKRK